MSKRRICLVPRLNGVGGMVSFQSRLTTGLEERGIGVTYQLQDTPYDAVLVIGGTRELGGLWRARRSDLHVVQRLDGMNWMHRRRPTGVRHFLRSEYGNMLLALIRARLADRIVYQSRFARGWWERVRGPTGKKKWIIYNGVDLDKYSPSGSHQRPANGYRVLMVEGSLAGGYEIGLESAARLVESLRETVHKPVELVVVGKVAPSLQENWQREARIPIHFIGQVSPMQVPEIDRSAHLLYSADLNAACPNTVIEALACGLPVAAFDTGSLPELVIGDAGRLVKYGGNPWKLDQPDIRALAQASAEILSDQDRFRRGARQRAEEAFGLVDMVEGYMAAFYG